MKKNKTISKLRLLSLLIIVTFSIHAQTTLDWVTQVGGVNSEDSQTIAVDANGNVFTMGLFEGTVDFDPSSATLNLVSIGGDDIYISKTDANGNLLWAKSFGGTNNEFAGTIALDPSGNVYVTGSAANTVDFDPGIGVFNLACDFYDAFILKIDGSGNFLWANNLGGSGVDFSTDVAIDPVGGVFVVGRFQSTANFDINGGGAILTSFGGTDGFVAKYSSAGNFSWVEQIGGTASDVVTSIDISSNGNLILAGTFRDVVDFDPSASSNTLNSNGNADLFVCKWTNAGVFSWAKSFGGSSSEALSEVIEDNLGNIYITGRFQSIVDFDPSGSIFNITPIASQDAFISKLNSSGDFVWAKNFGGTGISLGNSIALDASSNVYIFGHFQNVVDFDPNIGVDNLTSNGDSDAFLSKLDPSGNALWTESFGGSGTEQARSLFVDASNNIYITGNFEDIVDFDPTLAILNLTSNGNSDAYVLKMTVCSNSASTLNVSTCDSYVSPSGNNTWSISGTYLDTIPNSMGCDSLITVQLTVVSVDVSTTQTSGVITANNTLATSYQWIDCNNGNTIIIGETGVNYAPNTNGTYAVVISENNCTDTSACIDVSGVGINEGNNELSISVYPNPTFGSFRIESGNVLIREVKVYSITGKLIYHNSRFSESNNQIDLEIPTGVYLVQMHYEGQLRTIKLIIK